jgi:hypothetical protein
MRLFVICAMAAMALAQEPLNNEGVIKLVKSGMSEELIVSVIRQQPGSYQLGANDLIALKDGGVSEKVIAAMLARGKGEGAAVATGAATASAPKLSTSEPGLYYRKGNEFLELLTEDVEWKTSGAMRSIASAGIIKKDLNGGIPGASSRNFLTNPMEIILVPPQGLTVNAYILLPMKPDKGLREFRVGPVNSKSGVAKGAIPFGVEKVGPDRFRMVLQTPLPPGEYGVLAATPNATSTGTSKMYTFRILL